MKDDDAKQLESIYGSISNNIEDTVEFITESTDITLTEDIVGVLGMNNAKQLFGLLKRELPLCKDSVCSRRLEKSATILLDNIRNSVDNNMVQRLLVQYDDIPAISQLKIIYNLLGIQ